MGRSLKRKRKRSAAPLYLSLILIAAAVWLAAHFFKPGTPRGSKHIAHAMDRLEYYGLTSEEEAPIMVNDTILDVRGLVRNGKVYLDYNTVFNYLNSGFYWEAASSSLLLTEPSGTSRWTEADEELLLENGLPYVLADTVKEHSDIDMEILADPNRVVARTRWTDLTAYQATETGVVRYRGATKSEALTELEKGDVVVLLERADDWYKVSTADGFIGYIEGSRLKAADADAISHKHDTRFDFSHKFLDEPVVLGWQYVGSMEGNAALEELTAEAHSLNVVSPTWFTFANTAGDITSYASADYVSRAHSAGLKVWGCLQDVRGTDDLGDLFGTYERRAHIIDQLLAAASESGMDGINLDLETLEEEDAPHYLQFLKEISLAAHAQDLVVSTDVYVPMYTRYYNHKEQARTVDYIIVMAYDEHTSYSEEAGSVSSLPFVEQGITDILELVPKEQVVCGIPFYTRAWTQNLESGELESVAEGMSGAREFCAAHGIDTVWDGALGQYVGSSEDGTFRYSIWMEDLTSLEERLELIKRYELAGTAAWRLGFEDATVWPLIDAYFG